MSGRRQPGGGEPRRRALRVRAFRDRAAWFLAALVPLAWAAAEPLDAARVADVDPGALVQLQSLGDYLAAFGHSYRLPEAERAGLEAAQYGHQASALETGPRLSLRERLDLDGELELGLNLEVPLFDATAASRRALAQTEVKLRTLQAEAAHDAALAAFLQDVAALSLLAPAADLATALSEDQALAWVDTVDATGLPPETRGVYEGVLRAREMAAWLEDVRADTTMRIARRLGNASYELTPPAFHEFAGALAPAVALGDEADPVAACLAASPAVRMARARHEYAVRADEHEAALDLSVTLSGSLSSAVPLWAEAGFPTRGTFGAVGVQARLFLPQDWPVGGTLGVHAGTEGAFQELYLSWPHAVVAPSVPPDPGEQLAGELAMAADDARSYLRALRSARAERERSERALAWALIDAAPQTGPDDAQRLASDPWGPGWPSLPLEDHLLLAETRLETALARLRELGAAIDLAAHCGLLPGPSAREQRGAS